MKSNDLVRLQGLGTRVRDARFLYRWTQRDLAFKSGLPVSEISHIETGRRVPTLSNFLRIAEALGGNGDSLILYLLGSKMQFWKSKGIK